MHCFLNSHNYFVYSADPFADMYEIGIISYLTQNTDGLYKA